MQTLTEGIQVIDYSAGDMVVSEESHGDTLYIITKGAVEVVINLGRDDETVLAQLEERDFFGEMCIIEAASRSASVRAVKGPTTLYALSRKDIYHLYKKSPEQYSILILNIARDISRRLRKIDKLYAAKAH